MVASEWKPILEAVRNGERAEWSYSDGEKTYLRRFQPAERLILLGGGHVSLAVYRVAILLDYAVTVVDDRPAFANAGRFPEAAQVICDTFPNAIKSLHLRKSDSVCVMTRGHKDDADCLRCILPGAFPDYVGMIGSRRRVRGLMELLTQEGYDPERLAAIHSPIGLSINAQTPAEIAISICAQLVEHRRSKPKQVGVEYLEQAEPSLAVLERLADASAPCAFLMILETKGSTPAKSGAVMTVDALGHTIGTIGGGCSEGEALTRARQLIGTGECEIMSVDLTNEVAADQGMVCGGIMRVLICDVSAQ